MVLLLVHAALIVPAFRATWFDDTSTELGIFVVLLPIGPLLLGRVVLSFLPPGPVGSHAWSDLPVTAAVSFAVGLLIDRLASSLTDWGFWGWVPLVVVLALLRWITLPGAMVPRHRPHSEPLTQFDLLLVGIALGWSVYLYLSKTPLSAWSWLAISVVLFHGLGTARRQRLGRFWILGVTAALGAPPAVAGYLDELGPALLPALSLALGATFLVPWLRRADKRAGSLSALGFGSALLAGWDPLGFAGVATLLVASRRSQRAFALRASVCAALVFALPSLLGKDSFRRDRLLWGRNLLDWALDRHAWGLAWLSIAVALLAGALTFRWRGEPWSSGSIDEPRREIRALLLLLVLSAGSLALPLSPWSEEQALAILFPPAALLAGLLVIPAERPAPVATALRAEPSPAREPGRTNPA
jgi:hypothetical protein